MKNILFALTLLPTTSIHSQLISPTGVIARVIDSDARLQALAPGIVSTPSSDEWANSFTPDGKTVYFARATGGLPGYAMYAKLKNGAWQQPAIASFSATASSSSGGRYSDMDPFVSPNGKKIVFISNRPAENNPADSVKRSLHIWYVTYRGNDAWSTAHELDTAVNLHGIGNFGPSMSARGTLYYCTRRKDLQGMQSFYNEWLGDHYGPAKQVIVPGAREIQDPFIAPDESYLIYRNGKELDISFRQGKDWSAPQNLGPQVNSMEAGDPYVSPDGKTLYISAGNGDIMMIPIHLDHAHIKASLDPASPAPTVRATSASPAPTSTSSSKPELFAPGIISGPVDDAAPTFTPDGNTVYFHRRSSSFGGVILTSTCKDGKWSDPQIASFSGKWSDIEPSMSPDGSYLVFSSNRPPTAGGKPLNGRWGGQTHPQRGGNLWRVNWRGDAWGEPYRLPDIINGDTSTFSPAVTADGSIYFMHPQNDTGRFHIYYAALRSGRFDKPVPVSFSAADNRSDFDPVVAPDESFAVFCSNRIAVTYGQLFIVYRKDGKWGEPVSLGDGINWPSQSNQEARLSPDLRTLYFSNSYMPPVTYPSDSTTIRQQITQSLWFTGADNIWSVSLEPWLPIHQ